MEKTGKTETSGQTPAPAHHLKIYIAELPSDPRQEPAGKRKTAKAESALARELSKRALLDYLRDKSAQDTQCQDRNPEVDPAIDKTLQEVRSEGGKPFFPDYPAFHYNISHSGGIVICGTLLSEPANGEAPHSGIVSEPIGIDIQKIPDHPKQVLGIADHFFSHEEKESLHKLLDTGKEDDTKAALLLFTRYWTARESYMKLTGRGLRESFRSFRPDLEAGQILPGTTDESSAGGIYLTECQAPEGFCITACTYKVPGTTKFL